MPLPHLKIVKMKRNMTIFALHVSTDQPHLMLPSRSPRDATGCTTNLELLWVRALFHFTSESWSQAEHFRPCAGLPLGPVQQLA